MCRYETADKSGGSLETYSPRWKEAEVKRTKGNSRTRRCPIEQEVRNAFAHLLAANRSH